MPTLLIPLLKFSTRSALFMVIFWIGLFCIAEISAGGDLGEVLGKGGSKQREFDYFKLALQWPGTYCRRTRHCCSSNGCCRGSNGPTGFTIHGLWSDYNDGTWPSCCTGKRFYVKEVSTLLDALNKYWPSLSCGSSSNCHGGKGLFWEHEPRDCAEKSNTGSDIVNSKKACPSYVSLPEYASPKLGGRETVSMPTLRSSI